MASRSLFRCWFSRYRIQIPLPPKIDPSVTMMTVEAVVFFTLGWTQRHSQFLQRETMGLIMPAALLQEKPDVTYNDVGGAKEQLERLREACPKFPMESFWVWSFGWSWCREDLGWPPAGKGTTKKDIRDFGILVRTVRRVALSALLSAQATVRAVQQFWSPVAFGHSSAEFSWCGRSPACGTFWASFWWRFVQPKPQMGDVESFPEWGRTFLTRWKMPRTKDRRRNAEDQSPSPIADGMGVSKRLWLWNKREKSPPHIGAQNEQASNHQITGFAACSSKCRADQDQLGRQRSGLNARRAISFHPSEPFALSKVRFMPLGLGSLGLVKRWHRFKSHILGVCLGSRSETACCPWLFHPRKRNSVVIVDVLATVLQMSLPTCSM